MGKTTGDSPEEARAARGSAWRLWAGLACGLGLALLADGPVMAALQPVAGSTFAHALRHTVRWLGTGYVQVLALLLVVALGLALRSPLVQAGGWSLLAFGVAGAGANLLKVIVHRPRPWVTAAPPEAWLAYLRLHNFQSFPSGESTTSFAVAASLSAWLPAWRWALFAAAVVVAGARVVVGAHYLSDVWAGAMLGIAAGRWAAGLGGARRRRGSAPAR